MLFIFVLKKEETTMSKASRDFRGYYCTTTVITKIDQCFALHFC